eukprot:948498-Prorocentrum_minimum.AAC.1
MTTVSVSDMMALSLSDVLASGVLLSVLGGLMGGALVIALVGWRRNTLTRTQILHSLVAQPGAMSSLWYKEVRK